MFGGGNDIQNEVAFGGSYSRNDIMQQLFGSGQQRNRNGSTLHGSLEDILGEENITENSEKIESSGSMWLGTEDGK